MRLILGVVLLGCSANRPLYLPESPTSPPSSPPDLSSPPAADLSRPPASDLGGFCGGTGIAGTCVQGFFAAFADCFQPAGACVTSAPQLGAASWCWSNGAKIYRSDPSADHTWVFMSASGTACLSWTVHSNGQFMKAGDSKITFSPDTGVYSCDGVVDTVGPDCGGCAELCALLQAPPTGCSQGDCF